MNSPGLNLMYSYISPFALAPLVMNLIIAIAKLVLCMIMAIYELNRMELRIKLQSPFSDSLTNKTRNSLIQCV